MKKIIAVLLTLCMLALVFAGCGLPGKAAADASNGSDAAASSASGAAQADDATRAGGEAIGKAASYAEAYTQSAAIQEAVVAVMTELNDKYNASLEEGDLSGTEMLMYPLMLMSLDLAFTATFSEDPQAVEGVGLALEFLGVEDAEVQHPAPNEYGVTFTDNEGAAWVYEAKFDPGTGSLRFVEFKDGAPDGFYEFINLGNDNYAYQTSNERAFVSYKDGEVKSFAYSAMDSTENQYDQDADSIYPNGGVDAGWAIADGPDAYPQAYSYDGSTLKMDAQPMFGDRISIEIAK